MSSDFQPIPNFFIVGAPKAGTTSLYHYLAQHPEIYMSPMKEPCHFSTEIRVENFKDESGIGSLFKEQQKYVQGPEKEECVEVGMGWDDYLKLFRGVQNEKAVGEASVLYLWSKTAAENICAKIPGAKIIMVLRDPIERAFSQYMHGVTAGVLGCAFRKYVEDCLDYKSDKICILRPSLDAGLYFEGVKRYLDRFDSRNIRIFLYEELQSKQEWML